jgi:hypothetical protein
MKELERNVAEYLLDIVCHEIPNEIDKHIEVNFDPQDREESEERLGLFCVTACKYLLAEKYEDADHVEKHTIAFFNGYLTDIQQRNDGLLLHYDVIRFIAREVVDNYHERKQTASYLVA